MIKKEIIKIVGTTEIEVSRGVSMKKDTVLVVVNQALSKSGCHIMELTIAEVDRLMQSLMYVRYG